MTKLDLQQKLEQAEAYAISLDQLLSDRDNELFKLEAERDALQQQVNALAAEALYLKDEIVQHSQSTHFCKVCGEDDPCVNDDVCWALTHETPATDAIKRQWMAEGVEKFAAFWKSRCLHNDTFVGGEASNYAAQFRQPEEKGQ